MCGTQSCAETFDAHTLAYAINIGGDIFIDDNAFVYSADFGYNTGSRPKNTPNLFFSNTQDDVLYQTQRFAKTLQYNLPVTNGIYDITVKLAEHTYRENGRRVFNLMAEDDTLATNLDMHARFGLKRVEDITLKNVSVSDGQLTLLSEQIIENASIAGIVVTSLNGRATCDEACMENTRTTTPPVNTGTPNNGNLVHPGMLTSQSQLDLMKTRFAQGHQLTVDQVELMKKHVERFDKIRNPRTQNSATGGGNFIYCGSFNKGRDGTTTVRACNWPAEDGITTYTNALLGFITGEAKYTRQAIAFLDSWTNANNFKGFDTEGSNAPLQHGWIIPWFANAAEILRYTSASWNDQRTASMDEFITRMMKLVTADADLPPNNWLHARIEAHIASAIWLDDELELNKALARWRKMSRSYIYIDSDNNNPVGPAPTNLTDRRVKDRIWATNNYRQGATMETCRDLNHQYLGIDAIINSLAMANTQGMDVFRGNDNKERLMAYFKFMPTVIDKIKQSNRVLSNANASQAQKDQAFKEAKNPFSMCKSPVKNRPNTEARTNPQARAYPMAYNLLKTNSEPLTLVKRDIDNNASVTASRWLRKWETLIASTLTPIE